MSYDDLVRRHTLQLAPHIRHLPGATIVSTTLAQEISGWINLIEAELAGRSERINVRLCALRAALGRVDTTNNDRNALVTLTFEKEVDTATAARAMGVKLDTLRRALREGRVQGRRASNGWLIPLSAIEDYNRKAA